MFKIFKGLQTYARECQLRGKGLCVWRRATGTEIACPPNSRYDGCATACPNTCQFPFASTRYFENVYAKENQC